MKTPCGRASILVSLPASLLALSLTVACGSDNPGTGVPIGGAGTAGAFGSGGPFVGGGGAGAKPGQGGTAGSGASGDRAGQGGANEAGAGGAGLAGPSPGVRDVCDAYVACIATASPATLGPIADAYGKQGNCFDQGDEKLCEKACRTGLVQAHGTFPKVAACNYCDSAQDCGSGAPACDTKAHTCKACSNDDHCENEAFPACDTATFTCVACNANKGCDASSNRPVCDVPTHACVACQSDDDCADQAANGRGICGTSGKCRGCANDGECAVGRCDVSQQRCVGCLSDADCEDGGACDTFTNTCCGGGLCASKGFVCGTTVAGGCGGIFGTSVDCGTCGGLQHCRDHQCVDPPPTGCPAACASNERCAYDSSSNTRMCVPRAVDCEKANVTGCGPGYSCESRESDIPPFNRYYFCVAECLVDADCPPTGGKPGKCGASAGESGRCIY